MTTKEEPSISRATHLHLVLWRACRSVEEVARHSIAATGLCLSDFAVLEALLHRGEMPVNALGRRVLLTSGSITTAVDRLSQRDLVRRRSSPEDGRVCLVSLTPAGKRLIRKAFAQHDSSLDEAMAEIPAEEKETLIHLLKKLGKSVDRGEGRHENPKRN